MGEPDVTLTDYGLALECAVLAAWLSVSSPPKSSPPGSSTPLSSPPGSFQRASRLNRAGMFFFVFLGLSAATGGTVHGYCPDRTTFACRSLWTITLLLIGLAGSCTWQLGARIVSKTDFARSLALAGWPQLVLYVVNVLLITQEFWIAFTIYLPAALLLLAGFCRRALHAQGDQNDRIAPNDRGERRRAWILGATGSVLSLLSSAIQFLKIGIDPVYFNHNALAHVVQGVALVLLFVGIRHAARSLSLDDNRTISTDVSR